MSRNMSSSSSRYKISGSQPSSSDSRSHVPANQTQQSYQPYSGPHRSNGGPSSFSNPAQPDFPPRSNNRGLEPLTTGLDQFTMSGPVSPVSPDAPQPSFADPFAADRNARSALRAQANAAVESQSAPRGPATDKLRNVVGAFMSAGKQAKEESPRRPARAHKHEVWTSDGKFHELDAVMKRINRDYPFILQSDFSPSSLALKLLNSPQLSSFLELQAGLSSALQTTVQAHFQTFAASLPAHASFLSTLARAQQQVQISRSALREAREGFSGKAKSELATVRVRERMVKEMLQILDLIDDLKQVPDRLDSLIGEKRFLQAALVLVKSIKTINRDDIRDIGAMSELRHYFNTQETTLTDILVEELHNHLYLKTFYSDSLWRVFTPGQDMLPELDQRYAQYLSNLAVKPNSNPSLDTEIPQTLSSSASSGSLSALALPATESVNPEADSYSYMEALLEALAVLGRLGPALEMVVQRVPNEIHTLVESTLDEVEERSDSWSNELSAQPHSQLLRTGDMLGLLVSLEAMGPPKHAVVLRDLFWTLYSKLAAVMEGHRVVYEVARWILARGSETFNIPVLEIWRPVQNEVRSLLNTYLTDLEGSALERHALMSINEILRDGKLARDKQKAMFKFTETDMRAVSNDIKEIDDALKSRLKTSVPGLIGVQGTEASTSEDRSTKHRTLVPPNPFNVTVMFQPTLAFIEKAANIVPPGFEDETAQFGNILEDFVVKVFLPQLDEKVSGSFQQAIADADSLHFSFDKPPLKSSIRVMSLIHNLCSMLQTTPFHRENYSRLIVGVIVQYYQHCSNRFRDLTGMGEALPAVWAQREDIIQCLTEVRAIDPCDPEAPTLFQREVKMELSLVGDIPILESQLISSNRKIEALGNLTRSLRWFIDALLDLQEAGPSSADTPRLPLTKAMAQRYEAIVQTFEQLVEMVLNTLRLEVRARVVCNLSASLRKGDFRLESETLEPDPDIIDLNSSIIEYEEIASRTLSDTDKEFLFRGLGQLVDHIFIYAARSIKVVNLAGVNKIKRNIAAVQQLLRSLVDVSDALDRCVAYWDLYEKGPKAMLESIRTVKPLFSFEDYNTMLNLQCKIDQSDAPSSELNTYLIDLHALSMSIEGWDE